MITLAEFLLHNKTEYNGHKQTTIYGLSIEEALQLCQDLEEIDEKGCFFVLEIFTDKSFSIYQKNFWTKTENDGVLDRLILSVDNF